MAVAETADQTQLTVQQRDRLIAEVIDDVTHIATLPEITVKIVELVECPRSTAADLHAVISNDPALSARVLKVVNSAFYGLPGQIGSINRAIVLLGLNAVKNIAIAASLAKLFRGGRLCPTFAARDLWEHSLGVAAGTKLLAERIELPLADEAFLSGLIHDIGLMVLMQVRRPKLVQVLEKVENESIPFREAELQVIGATHEQFGKALCEKWKFPASLARVAGHHHEPTRLDPESRALACLVHAADVLAGETGVGYAGTVAHEKIDEQVLAELKLTGDALDEIRNELPEAARVADTLMS